jgi:CRP-like cAMP-binding protein
MSEREDTARTLGLLATIPLFSSLDERQLKTIAKTAQEKSIPAGATIVRQGEKGIGLYLILGGEVNVEKGGKKVATLRPGQFFGEMALLDEEPRTADVRAAGPVRCLLLSRWEFWGALADQPEVIRALLVETVRRLRASTSALTE